MNRSETDYERFAQSSPEARRLLHQEELILEVTEALTVALGRANLSRTELASRLGKSKGFVSQILAGGRNLTLRTVADVASAIGQRARVTLCDRDECVEKALNAIEPQVSKHPTTRSGNSQTSTGRSTGGRTGGRSSRQQWLG